MEYVFGQVFALSLGSLATSNSNLVYYMLSLLGDKWYYKIYVGREFQIKMSTGFQQTFRDNMYLTCSCGLDII